MEVAAASQEPVQVDPYVRTLLSHLLTLVLQKSPLPKKRADPPTKPKEAPRRQKASHKEAVQDAQSAKVKAKQDDVRICHPWQNEILILSRDSVLC